jgi:hypothetical protein
MAGRPDREAVTFQETGKKDDFDGYVTSAELSSEWKPRTEYFNVYKGRVQLSLYD